MEVAVCVGGAVAVSVVLFVGDNVSVPAGEGVAVDIRAMINVPGSDDIIIPAGEVVAVGMDARMEEAVKAIALTDETS